MLERIIKNKRTTVAAVVPAIVVLAGWLGLSIDPVKLASVAAAFYAVLLLFSKDQPKV